MYIIFTCPPLPHLIVGGKSLYRVGDLHLRRIMPSTFDLIFVTAGKLYLEENSQKYILKKGEFLILPPNRLHKGYKCCDEATDFFWLHFYTTGKFKYMDKPIYDKNHKQKANYQFTKEPFHISLPQHGSLTSEQQSQMAEYMNTIVQVKIDKTKPKKDFYSSTVSQLKSQQLFFSILSILCDIHEPNTKNVAEKIYEHFSLFYTESFDLKKLSDEYAFHPTHIIRCVKNKYGLSPLQLLLHIRIQKAKELLKEAGYENGEGLPTIELMYNSEGSHKDICQIIQQNLAEVGITVELTNQEWAVFLNTRQNGEYEFARHGWIGDYSDPMTFLDMWVTGGGNNDCGFSNAEYDNLINDAKVEIDLTKRTEMLRKAEDILMDEMPIIPIYYYTNVRAWNDNVKGIQCSTLGKIYFKGAYKE